MGLMIARADSSDLVHVTVLIFFIFNNGRLN